MKTLSLSVLSKNAKINLYTTNSFIVNHDVKAEIIQGIEIKNNVRVSKQTIINFGKVELGKDYSDNDLNIILKFYNTNFFSDVSISIKIIF